MLLSYKEVGELFPERLLNSLCFSTSNGGVLSYNKEGVLPADELFVEFGESLLPTVRGLDNECCKFLDLGTFLSLGELDDTDPSRTNRRRSDTFLLSQDELFEWPTLTDRNVEAGVVLNVSSLVSFNVVRAASSVAESGRLLLLSSQDDPELFLISLESRLWSSLIDVDGVFVADRLTFEWELLAFSANKLETLDTLDV